MTHEEYLFSICLLLDESCLVALLARLDIKQKKYVLQKGMSFIGYDNSSIYEEYSDEDLTMAIIHVASQCRGELPSVKKVLDVVMEFNISERVIDKKEKKDSLAKNQSKSTRDFLPNYPIVSIKPNEQQEIIIENCDRGIKVDSFAGAGKSTLSSLIINRLGLDKCLYTAYLKENINDAHLRITKNASTQSALACRYALPVSPFLDFFEGKSPVPRYSSLMQLIGFDRSLDVGGKILRSQAISRVIHNTVLNFCMSTSSKISSEHVPPSVVEIQARLKLVRWSEAYWDYLLSGRNALGFKVSFPHVMKFWSLNPDIKIGESIRNIILDEAQDIDGAFYNVILNHSDRNVIVIGDSYQQLFSWRGAVNSMLLFDRPSLPLSISYRFDQSIADYSNSLLENHSIPPKGKILGRADHVSNVIFYGENELVGVDADVILTRTRGRIIELAEKEIRGGAKICVKTEFEVIKWVLLDLIKLRNGDLNGVTYPYLQRCYSFYSLEAELDDLPEPEVFFALNLLKKYDEKAVEIIELIARNNVPESDAVKIISTTHSIKGREWRNVIIADDYEYLFKKNHGDIDSEISVLYVAITRAKENVYIPRGLAHLFK